jgi:hypothetical protein
MIILGKKSIATYNMLKQAGKLNKHPAPSTQHPVTSSQHPVTSNNSAKYKK